MTSLDPLPQSAFVPGKSEGIFQLDWPTYKSDPGLNQSSLKIIRRSYAHWLAEKKREAEKKKEPTPDQILGSLVHLATLEPQLFGEGKSHWIEPAKYPAPKGSKKVKSGEVAEGAPIPWNNRAQFCKDWYEAREESGMPVIDEDTLIRVLGMRDAIIKDEVGGDFINAGHTEVALFVVDPVTKIRLKCRLDILAETEGEIFLGDCKKMDDAQEEGAARTFAKFGYYIQAATSKRILQLLLEKFKLPIRPIRFINLCVEHNLPHEVVTYELDDRSLELGYKHFLEGLQKYQAAQNAGKPLGYDKTTLIRKLVLPRWLLRDPNQDED